MTGPALMSACHPVSHPHPPPSHGGFTERLPAGADHHLEGIGERGRELDGEGWVL